MHDGNAQSPPALGFLTVVEHPEHGLFGGYLLLNTAGRPLEFHCTAPIRPNRAQEILYGPTLAPFIYGEQIGQTMLAKAKTKPLVVCTDREPALAVREFSSVPVVLVIAPEEIEENDVDSQAYDNSRSRHDGKLWRLDKAHLDTPPLITFTLGRNRLAVPAVAEQDRRQISESLASVADSFDLAEPFGRIREAIDEARRGGQ